MHAGEGQLAAYCWSACCLSWPSRWAARQSMGPDWRSRSHTCGGMECAWCLRTKRYVQHDCSSLLAAHLWQQGSCTDPTCRAGARHGRALHSVHAWAGDQRVLKSLSWPWMASFQEGACFLKVKPTAWICRRRQHHALI